MINGNIFDELNRAFVKSIYKSELRRLEMFREFAVFYNNDYECIVDYLKEATLNNPYSQNTLDRLRFNHIHIIDKIVSRITSGIFLKDPIIDTKDDNLAKVLSDSRFFVKVKEAFKKAVFFNTVEVQVVWDEGLRIDVITPDNFLVETKKDYLKKKAIGVNNTDTDNTVYTSVWTEEDHYIIKGDKQFAVDGNPDMKNPYQDYALKHKMSAIPFVTLRMNEGLDFYGEPNWNIFLHQKNFDIRLTDLNETELKTLHQILLGINTNFSEGETFKPGQIKQVNNVKTDEVAPSLTAVNPTVDYTSLRENVEWLNRMVQTSEGLSGGTASTDIGEAQSGTAKLIDEVELIEKREEYKGTLYYFMINLLNVVRMVHNTYDTQKLNEEEEYEIKFVDNKVWETIDDKTKRYDLGTAHGYLDSIDIAQEELEISEEEAIERIKIRKERNVQASTEEETV